MRWESYEVGMASYWDSTRQTHYVVYADWQSNLIALSDANGWRRTNVAPIWGCCSGKALQRQRHGPSTTLSMIRRAFKAASVLSSIRRWPTSMQ
jgi:hypothetical protein